MKWTFLSYDDCIQITGNVTQNNEPCDYFEIKNGTLALDENGELVRNSNICSVSINSL